MTKRHLPLSLRALVGALILSLVASLTPGLVATAEAAETSLSVTVWDRDWQTGEIAYDLDFSSGPCTGSCSWKVEGYYRDGTTELLKATLGSGSFAGSAANPAHLSESLTGAGTFHEITHLKMTVAGALNATDWSTVSGPYPDGNVTLTVNTWDQNVDTGKATYDFDVEFVGARQVNGPCDGYCYLYVEALYRDGTTELLHRSFLSGSPQANNWTFSQNFAATDETMREVTDLKARLRPDAPARETYTDLVHVSDGYPDGNVTLTVNTWDQNVDTGKATYDFDVEFFGARQVNGPCDGYCYLYVEGLNNDGVVQHTFLSGTSYSNHWSATRSFAASDISMREITKLRARLVPNPTTRETYTETATMSGAYPHGNVSVAVERWDRDPATGQATYDFDVTFVGARQDNGPCDGYCYLYVEGLNTDGVVQHTFLSGTSYSNNWSATRNFLNTTGSSLPGISEIRARLVPSIETRETYADSTRVSDLTLDDIDASDLAFVLASANVTQDELCLIVEERARILRIPDATPHTTPHATTEACLTAGSVRRALIAIAAVVGGAAVIGAIIHHYADGPNADPIAKVPQPETDTAGSGVRPPTSCLSGAQKTSILNELEAGGWNQDHHVATNKGRDWKQLFKDLLAQHEYAADKSLDSPWNKIEGMPHRGKHSPAYHFWVYRNMAKALEEASDWASFEGLWEEWVVDVVESDPTMVRGEWWRC